MPGDALLDAVDDAVDTSADQTTDTSTDSTATDDSAQTTDQTQTQDDSAPVIADANGQLKLSEKARAELDRIKAENPRLAREMRAALFDRQTLLSKVPGGVKEALATIEAYEADGGSEAVQQVKQELSAWKSLDEDFQAAKPQFVNDIAAGSPEAFTKLAPHVMAKFAEMAPEVYSHEVSKVFAADMAANDVLLNMRLLQREIGALPEANRGPVQQLWNSLAAYVDRVNGLAKTAPKQEVKPAQANPTGNSELDQREQQLTVREFGSERSRIYDSVTESEFKRNLGNRKASETQVSAIRELYDSRLDKLLRADKKHTDAVDRFLAAKDKAGYAKHMQAAYKSKAPLAMDEAFKVIMPGKPGPAAKPATKVADNGAKPADTTGWTRVAAKPAPNTVAHWKMTTKMLKEGKYILRDGKQVIFNGR